MKVATPIKLGESGYQAALLVQGDSGDKLVLFQSTDLEEHTYAPAVSMEVYGRQALIAIRDALNNAFPPGA